MADTITISFDGAPAVIAKLNDLKKTAGDAAMAISKTTAAFKTLSAEARKITAAADAAAVMARRTRESEVAAITAGRAQANLTARLTELQTAHAKAAQSATQHDGDVAKLFGTLSDAALSLASEKSPFKVLAEEGAELGELLGGPLGVAVSSAAMSFDLFAQAQQAAAGASEALRDGQSGAAAALANALDFAERYQMRTDGLSAALDTLLVGEDAAAKAALNTAGAHGEAAKRAMERALAEKAAAEGMLLTKAIDLEEAAAKQDKSADGFFGTRRQSQGLLRLSETWWAPPIAKAFGFDLQDAASTLSDQAAASNQTAEILRKNAQILRQQFDELQSQLPMVTDHLSAAGEAHNRTAGAARDHATAIGATASAYGRLEQAAAHVIDGYMTPVERATAKLRNEQLDLRRALDAGIITAEQFWVTIDRQQAPVLSKAQLPDFSDLKSSEANRQYINDELEGSRQNVGKAFREAADAVSSFKSAIKQNDWSAAFGALKQTVDTVKTAFRGNGVVGGLSATAGAIGSLIGGKTGNAIAGAASLAGTGLLAGSQLSAWALANSASSFAGLAGTIAPILGPIGLIAGVAMLASSFLGGKPSNHAGIAQLGDGGYRLVSSGKETAETSQAAANAADAILRGEASLRAYGITLGRTVAAVDIGTRDKTAITLSDATRFRTGSVGDAAEAADSALKAVLEGATYVNEAQKTLVQSALAAGEGFDKVAEKLSAYAEAQKLPEQLDRAILKFKDPRANAEAELKDAQVARRDSAQAMADAGYLTAAQLESINDQLATLEGLELAETLRQFTEAAENAANELAKQRRSLEADLAEASGNTSGATVIRRQLALEDLDPSLRRLQTQVWTVQDAATAVATAHDALAEAYKGDASAYQATIDKFRQFSRALREFRDSLSIEGLGGGATASIRRAQLVGALSAVRGGGEGAEAALSALPGVGRDYLDAAKSQARSAAEYASEVSYVRASVEEAERYAETQASVAEQQLDALNAQVAGILMVNDSVQSVASLLTNYTNAQAQFTAASGGGGSALTDQMMEAYLKANPDLVSSWASGGRMRELGPDIISAARTHYLMQGQFEHAVGGRPLGFATGGSFEVAGAPGLDQNLIPLRLTRGEVVNIRRPGGANDNSAVVGAVQRLEARLGDMADALVAANSKLASLEKLNRKWDGDGMPQTRNTGTQ